MDFKMEVATSQDVDAIAQLYDEVNDALAQGINYPGWAKGIYPIKEDAQKAVEEQSLFKICQGDKLIGSVVLNHIGESAYALAQWNYTGDAKNIFVIHTLMVHPACGNQGIGKQILKLVDAYALDNGIKAIHLDVREQNLPAIRLYEKCDYTHIATVDLGYEATGNPQFRLYEKLIEKEN